MSQPKVSVIIPVYKVEQYIENCVRTLFGQTLEDMEFIFVDDCSPDFSIAIMKQVLEEFPERKEQVKLIRHNPNEGVSKSRQDGIDAATGEYIIHCDPDDWVELDMYESLYNKAKEADADLVICNFSNVSQDEIKHSDEQPLAMSSISVLESICGRTKKKLHGSTCNKLLIRKYAKSGIFPSDISYCEDVYYWFQIFQNNLKISFLNRYLYYYRSNESGLVSSDSKIQQQRCIHLYNHITELIASSSDQRYIMCCKSFICELIFVRLFLKGILSNPEFTTLFRNSNLDLNANRILKFHHKLFFRFAILGFRSQSKYLYNYFKNLVKS